ncbi:carbohydrate-binding module family 5 protein [Atractiella rhizophila]|nr:carbohydrate-binding module family 5 protein [Atractiella rhizophila]
MLSTTSFITFLSALIAVQATPSMDRPAGFARNTTVEVIQPNPHFNYTLDGGFATIQEVSASANGKINMGYFAQWGVYTTGRNFPPQSIPASQLTHILYAFFDCDGTTGALKSADSYADFDLHCQFPYSASRLMPNLNGKERESWKERGNKGKGKNPLLKSNGNIKQLFKLKLANRGLKTLLSVGGWTYGQAGHFNFVTNPSARATFIQTAITLMEDCGFDGIDIDYEYPTSTAQGQGFADLLTELRTALNSHAAAKGDSVPYLLTAAVGAGPSGYTYLNIAQMSTALDFINLMAYDYSGSWSTVSDHQANLYGGTPSGFSTEAALSYYTSHGAPLSKIIMGLPLYGRAFADTNGLYQAYNGVGAGSWENGIWDYKALPLSGQTVTDDTSKVGAYSYGSNRVLVSYDDPATAVTKTNYIKSNGLAGAMYWELSSDKTGSASIVSTVKNNLGGLDTTQNHISYPGSKYDNIKNQLGNGGTTTTTTTNPGGTGGTGCGGVAAWDAAKVYVAGDRASYGGFLWQAQWWTQGETPVEGDGKPWKKVSAC